MFRKFSVWITGGRDGDVFSLIKTPYFLEKSSDKERRRVRTRLRQGYESRFKRRCPRAAEWIPYARGRGGRLVERGLARPVDEHAHETPEARQGSQGDHERPVELCRDLVVTLDMGRVVSLCHEGLRFPGRGERG